MKKDFDIKRPPAGSDPTCPTADSAGITGIAAKSTAVAGADTAAAGTTAGSTAVNDSAAALSQGATESGSTGSNDPAAGTAAAGFRVSVGYATAAAEEISGDTAISSGLPDGSLALILSDGMGKGIRAAALSRGVANRLRKNLKGGMAPAHAIKEVNAYMLTHRQAEEEGENFATVDLLIIDRTTEKAKFYKMGAATSFVLRDGKVKMLEKAALPIGIVPKVRSSQISERLRPGDIVIMVSDGITEAGREREAVQKTREGREREAGEALGNEATCEIAGIDGTWLRELLEDVAVAGGVDFAEMSPRRLANWILKEAVEKYADRERDDLTVAVVKIVQSGRDKRG